MYFMSDPQALHVTRNVIPSKLGVDLHLHRVHIPLVKTRMLAMEKLQLLQLLLLRRSLLKVGNIAIRHRVSVELTAVSRVLTD